MNAVQLQRIDPTQSMARFYRLDVQPSLFGWSSVYEWGRIGRPGQVQVRLFESEGEARACFDKKLKEKLKGGYAHIFTQNS